MQMCTGSTYILMYACDLYTDNIFRHNVTYSQYCNPFYCLHILKFLKIFRMALRYLLKKQGAKHPNYVHKYLNPINLPDPEAGRRQSE